MNLPTSHIKAVARKLFKTGRQTAVPKLVNPERDWAIGVVCGVCLLVGIMSWSAYMYVTNRSGITGVIATEANTPAYRAAMVNEALQHFKDREAAFVAHRQQAAPPLPPPGPPVGLEASSTLPSRPNATNTPVGVPRPEELILDPRAPVQSGGAVLLDS